MKDRWSAHRPIIALLCTTPSSALKIVSLASLRVIDTIPLPNVTEPILSIEASTRFVCLLSHHTVSLYDSATFSFIRTIECQRPVVPSRALAATGTIESSAGNSNTIPCNSNSSPSVGAATATATQTSDLEPLAHASDVVAVISLSSRWIAFNSIDLPPNAADTVKATDYYFDVAKTVTREVAKNVAKFGMIVLQEAYFYANGTTPYHSHSPTALPISASSAVPSNASPQSNSSSPVFPLPPLHSDPPDVPASLSPTGAVKIIDLVDGQVIAHFVAHHSRLSFLRFDESGTLLATASVVGRSINVFSIELPEGRLPAQIVHRYKLVRGATTASFVDLAFSKDGSYLAATSSRGTVHVYALPDTAPIGECTVLQVAFRLRDEISWNFKPTLAPTVASVFLESVPSKSTRKIATLSRDGRLLRHIITPSPGNTDEFSLSVESVLDLMLPVTEVVKPFAESAAPTPHVENATSVWLSHVGVHHRHSSGVNLWASPQFTFNGTTLSVHDGSVNQVDIPVLIVPGTDDIAKAMNIPFVFDQNGTITTAPIKSDETTTTIHEPLNIRLEDRF
eukprot:c9896_g1_i3.p1 GENE.c9896_g1_i3~~c9896_g1_i3.p1  ORF type:complete len:566 (-),score=153.13 c9896_g1_i3:20-1717(-)